MLCKLRTVVVIGYRKFKDIFILGDESALVVGWGRAAIFLIITAILLIICGPIVDQVYAYVNTTNNSTSSLTYHFYTDWNVQTVKDIYGFYQWLKYIAIGAAILFLVNYANVKKGGDTQ